MQLIIRNEKKKFALNHGFQMQFVFTCVFVLMYPLSTTRKHQKTPVLQYFHGVEKGCIGNKWIKNSEQVIELK